MRQIHHWAALFFMAAIVVHMLRIFFTGAFRKPRELNWVIGFIAVHPRPWPRASPATRCPTTCSRATACASSTASSSRIPVVGTYMTFFIFGGEFPGSDFIPRLYTLHILLVPGIILALVACTCADRRTTSTRSTPAPAAPNTNVVGYPLFPVYMAKAGGFFFIVFGVTALIAAMCHDQPDLELRPVRPRHQVSAGSQPDWYIGFLDGVLRLIPPGWETCLGPHCRSTSSSRRSSCPASCSRCSLRLPVHRGWVTGDKREHHIARPAAQRARPARRSASMSITFYGILILNGANDIIAQMTSIPFNYITWFTRVGIFVFPPLAFVATRRFCLGLQRRDRELLLHGRESGQILRLPHGEFIEIHTPISDAQKAVILSKVDMPVIEAPPATDENGVATPGIRGKRLRAAWSRFYFGDNVARPTPAELEEAAHHAHVEHDHEVEELSEAGKDVPARLTD